MKHDSFRVPIKKSYLYYRHIHWSLRSSCHSTFLQPFLKQAHNNFAAKHSSYKDKEITEKK